MEKFQQSIGNCLAKLRQSRVNNSKAIDKLLLADKNKLYDIIKDLNDFEDILIINYLSKKL